MPTFEAAARKVNLTGAEFLEIADYLSRHPEAGDVIKAPAACPRCDSRVRVAASAAAIASRPLYLLSIYAKAHKGDLSAGELKQLSKIAAAVKQEAQ